MPMWSVKSVECTLTKYASYLHIFIDIPAILTHKSEFIANLINDQLQKSWLATILKSLKML